MRLLTLFEAYERVVCRRQSAAVSRGDTFGISVRGDRWAREYQRYDRLARKLSRRILQRLNNDPS